MANINKNMEFTDKEGADSQILDLNQLFGRVFGEAIPAYEVGIKSKNPDQEQHRDILSNMVGLYSTLENCLYSTIIESFISTFVSNVDAGRITLTKIEKLAAGNLWSKWNQLINVGKIGVSDYFSFKEDIATLQDSLDDKNQIATGILDKFEEFVGLIHKEEVLNDFRVYINSQLRKTGNSNMMIESQRLDKVGPLEFEHLVARIFDLMGYETKVTPGSGDYGIDIIAKNEKETIAIQCKKYDETIKISNREIQMFLGAIQLKGHSISRGIFITTSDYTDQALRQADGNNVELWNGHKLGKIMNEYLLKGEFKN